MPDKKKSWLDILKMKPSKEALEKAGKTGGKGKYAPPKKAQSTSYLQKQIAEQERLKKEKKKKDRAMDSLAGK